MQVLSVRYGAPEAPALFARSIRETGFAVLTGHPIPTGLVADTFADWERFFATEEKHAFTFDQKIQAGYFPFKTEKAKGYSVFDLKEFYHYYPARAALPKSVTRGTEDLYARMTALGAELLGWIDDNTPAEVSATLSMPLRKMIQNSHETLLRILHYPPLTGGEEAGAIRAAEHEDINLITLLPAATAPGLQVKDTKGQWHDVDCDPGSIVINAGDMLQMATNGYYVSTPHRVMNPMGEAAKKSRFSMPLFLHPDTDVPLADGRTAGQYLKERLTEIGLLR